MTDHRLPPVDPRELAAGVFPADELATYQAAGYGRTARPGSRPALLIVDVTYAFTGDRGGTDEYPLSCGDAAWQAVDHIAKLVEVARPAGIPIVYSRNSPREARAELGGWAGKLEQRPEPARAHDIVDEISPHRGDLVITKTKPSAFFATPLASWLIELQVNTLLVAGGSTSGCVRASVVDAFSYNLNPFVVREATFDRSGTSHSANLFELHQKYATVTTVMAAVSYLASTLI